MGTYLMMRAKMHRFRSNSGTWIKQYVFLAEEFLLQSALTTLVCMCHLRLSMLGITFSVKEGNCLQVSLWNSERTSCVCTYFVRPCLSALNLSNSCISGKQLCPPVISNIFQLFACWNLAICSMLLRGSWNVFQMRKHTGGFKLTIVESVE